LVTVATISICLCWLGTRTNRTVVYSLRRNDSTFKIIDFILSINDSSLQISDFSSLRINDFILRINDSSLKSNLGYTGLFFITKDITEAPSD
jgi:hypothetical protein